MDKPAIFNNPQIITDGPQQVSNGKRNNHLYKTFNAAGTWAKNNLIIDASICSQQAVFVQEHRHYVKGDATESFNWRENYRQPAPAWQRETKLR